MVLLLQEILNKKFMSIKKRLPIQKKNKALTEGQDVEFSVIRTAAGLEAADVIGF
ncbi:hypothetical protein PROPEN_04618 [Proteus penneri ATCC 35198]|nr:hypothetical protein PROPEN_04618 [Proteus penneri ATCC 35198]